MRRINTEELTIYQNDNNERSLPDAAAGTLTIESGYAKVGGAVLRSWWIAGMFGVLQFDGLYQDDCLRACEETLAKAGYKASGELPPCVFEYNR